MRLTVIFFAGQGNLLSVRGCYPLSQTELAVGKLSRDISLWLFSFAKPKLFWPVLVITVTAFVSWSKSQIQVIDIAYPFPVFEMVYFKNIDNKVEGSDGIKPGKKWIWIFKILFEGGLRQASLWVDECGLLTHFYTIDE